MMYGEPKVFVTFTAPKDLPEIHAAILKVMAEALNEYCITEDLEELDMAIKCLKVLRLYVTPEETLTAP